MTLFISSKITHLLGEGAAYLKEHGIPNSQLDARLLLQHVLNQSQEFLIREPQHLCNENQMDHYNRLLMRRVRHEPVSKIIGVKEFWGLLFMVNKDVLDPRPDSETIIESVRENFIDTNYPYGILDLGVGSGCLLLSLLHEYPNAMGVGVDISSKVLQVAQRNARALGMEKRTQFVNTSWGMGLTDQYDLIVSNPPYIPSAIISTLEPEVKQFDPLCALDGGIDGLECYRQLAREVTRILKPDGHLFLEIGQGQENDVVVILKKHGLNLLTWKKDMQGIIRCGIFSQKY